MLCRFFYIPLPAGREGLVKTTIRPWEGAGSARVESGHDNARKREPDPARLRFIPQAALGVRHTPRPLPVPVLHGHLPALALYASSGFHFVIYT